MDCERKECGHPLNQHDPCAAEGCQCRSFVPKARKERAALISDIERGKRPGKNR